MSNISLFDLNQQLPFNIDAKIKKELCFGQALLISCGHYEGDIEEESDFESDWSSTVVEEEKSEEIKQAGEMAEYSDFPEIEEEEEHVEEEEYEDFGFFFFPDCNKPAPKLTGKESVTMVDGFPKRVGKAKMRQDSQCRCARGGDFVCECFMKLPCKCGAKTKAECTCANLKSICICDDPNKPSIKCKCGNAKICTCFPEMFPRATCQCDKLEKICVCGAREGKFPSIICTCKRKPKFKEIEMKSFDFGEEHRNADPDTTITSVTSMRVEGEELYESISIPEPCTCLKIDPLAPCVCHLKKEKKCTCPPDACVCGVTKLCVCEPDPKTKIAPCKSTDKIELCECPMPEPECVCDDDGSSCKCIPKEPPICTCGDPDNCKCFSKCLCDEPCVCDADNDEELTECVCLVKNDEPICTCVRKAGPKKLKRVKVRKEGYRWCHDVDPHHTYFDYAYDRHDKIDSKLQEREMFKVLGLYDEKEQEEECQVHKVQAPEYKRKNRKQSLDCCSTVGGISFNVETLGDVEDKFLIQVVSNSSKEGAKTGTKLISIVDCNLHTIEENRIEYITKKEFTKERRSYVSITDTGYFNKVVRNCGERSVVRRFYHTFENAHDFLLEGANVVLLRYLALSRHKGTVKTETITMKGTICESIYVSRGVSQAVVNNTPLFVVKIERHIIEPSGIIHQTLSVLTLRGYLVSHEWADNNYMMHLNPLLKVNSIKDEIEDHAPLRERWREDMQLLSDYLNFKSTRTAEGARYMTESGDLTAFIKDYLQSILLLKPQNVMHFTRHYFSSALSVIDLPHNQYFQHSAKHVRYRYFEC